MCFENTDVSLLTEVMCLVNHQAPTAKPKFQLTFNRSENFMSRVSNPWPWCYDFMTHSIVHKDFPSRDSNPWPWSRWGLDDQKTLMGTNIRRFSINRFRHFSVRLFFDPELEQATDLDDDDDDEKRFARLSQHVISWLVTQQFAKRQFADIQIANYFNFLA